MQQGSKASAVSNWRRNHRYFQQHHSDNCMSATKMSGQARDNNVGSAAQAVRYSYMCQLCLSKRSASTIKQGTKKTVRRTVRSFQPAFNAHKQINFQEDRHRISDIAVGPGPSFYRQAWNSMFSWNSRLLCSKRLN